MSNPKIEDIERRHPLSKEDAEEIAEACAEKAMQRMFQLLGVDIFNQESVNSFRADLIHAHSMRKMTERGGTAALLVIVGTAVTGIMALVVAAFRPHGAP